MALFEFYLQNDFENLSFLGNSHNFVTNIDKTFYVEFSVVDDFYKKIIF